MDELTHLLRSAADGDRTALAELIGETQADVYRFCASLVGPRHAEDVTQETFVRAWRSAKGFRGEAKVTTWLLAIARRACADHLERQRRSDKTIEHLQVRPPTADPGGAVDLMELIAGLADERRVPFVLTQLHGLSYAETAEVCGCPVGTVRSRIARARADLVDAYHASDGPAASGRER
jgi:RNA polymerase sigma-70 factor (ECF subfamily)